jgi:hypothetical protein
MKRFFTIILMSTFAISVSAQVMRADTNLEMFTKETFGEKWEDAAKNLGQQLSLDENNYLVYGMVIDCGEQTKDQLYSTLNSWFMSAFNNWSSENDEEEGVIMGKADFVCIASHSGGANIYDVFICPLIRVDIRDQQVRVIYIIQHYYVVKIKGGGIMGGFVSIFPRESGEKWMLNKCFPFQEKDGYKAKKVSSKALVMTHVYSNLIIHKIEDIVKNGLSETDDWETTGADL